MQLKITNTDGSAIYSDNIISVTVNSAGRITSVTYGSTTVSSIVAFNGSNTKYEVGHLGSRGVINALLANYAI
jgi:hypothetical protein